MAFMVKQRLGDAANYGPFARDGKQKVWRLVCEN